VNLVSLRTARNNAAISDYALRDFTLQLVAQVETAYWGLAMAQETLRIQEFALGLAQEQLDLNQAMISVGKLSGSARFSAESEVASKKADLVNAQAALINRAINLWQLLNPDTQTPESLQFLPITLPEVRDPVPTPAECVALADLFRPDLAQARLDLANGQLAVVQTKNGLLPQLDAFVSYGANSSGAGSGSWSRYLDDMTYDRFEAGLSFTLTLGNRAEKARYQRAKLQLDQAGASIRNLQQNIEAELRKAIAESAREVEQVAASHQEVINREQELAVETEQFRLGRSTNLNVLQVQQKLVQAKMQEAAARVGRLQAVTSLYQKEGTLLTRRGIVLDKDREPLS
jgi:outer membrane protein TolC